MSSFSFLFKTDLHLSLLNDYYGNQKIDSKDTIHKIPTRGNRDENSYYFEKKNTYTDRTVFSHATTRKSCIIYDITYTFAFRSIEFVIGLNFQQGHSQQKLGMCDKEYTTEELNYFRVCYITTSIIRDGLEAVFKQEWNRVHESILGTWKDTAKNGHDFFNMESSRSKRRNIKLLKIIQNGNTKEWDSTCFFFAILYSDSLRPRLSPTVVSQVEVLRGFRNTVFAHSSQAHILETDFRASVTIVTNAFMALHLDTKQLQNISSQKSFPTEELQQLQEKVKALEEELGEPKSFMCLPPKPSHEVVERKSETNKIRKCLLNFGMTMMMPRLYQFMSMEIQDVVKVRLLVTWEKRSMKKQFSTLTKTIVHL